MDENKYERLARDKNLLERVNSNLEKEIVKMETEKNYYKKRTRTLEAIEKSLPERIKKYKKQTTKEAKAVVKELEWWYNMLMDEKKAVESDDEE